MKKIFALLSGISLLSFSTALSVVPTGDVQAKNMLGLDYITKDDNEIQNNFNYLDYAKNVSSESFDVTKISVIDTIPNVILTSEGYDPLSMEDPAHSVLVFGNEDNLDAYTKGATSDDLEESIKTIGAQAGVLSDSTIEEDYSLTYYYSLWESGSEVGYNILQEGKLTFINYEAA